MSPRGSAQVPSQRFAWECTGCLDTGPAGPLRGSPELGGPSGGGGACGAQEGRGRPQHRLGRLARAPGALPASETREGSEACVRPGLLSDLSLRCPVLTVNAASLSTGAPVNNRRAGAPGGPRLMARPRRPLGRCPARSGRLQFASACAAPGAAQRTDGEADRGWRGCCAGRGGRRGGGGGPAPFPAT